MSIIRNSAALLLLLLSIFPMPLSAQDDGANSNDTTTIDILASSGSQYGPEPPMEDCSAEQEAAILSGEIIVCRRKQDQSKYRTVPNKEAQARYARETQYAGDLLPPDVAGPGIFRGPATVGGLCLIPPCPREAALIIDIEALPEAPPGSDADRIARGLPPLGNDKGIEALEAGQPTPQGQPPSSRAEAAEPEEQP